MRSNPTRLHVCPLGRALLSAAIGMLLVAGFPAAAQMRPASYAEFDVSIPPGDATALRAAISSGLRDAI